MNIEDLLLKIPEKSEDKWTTSKKFKRDIYNYFNIPEFKDKTCLEIGCYKCYTTLILSKLFKTVYGINHTHYPSIEKFLEENDCNNINIIIQDVYSKGLPFINADVIMIDAVHTYDAVLQNVNDSLKLISFNKKYFIFDDYGIEPPLKKVITDLCDIGKLKFIKKIGCSPNDTFHRPLYDYEGVICKEV